MSTLATLWLTIGTLLHSVFIGAPESLKLFYAPFPEPHQYQRERDENNVSPTTPKNASSPTSSMAHEADIVTSLAQYPHTWLPIVDNPNSLYTLGDGSVYFRKSYVVDLADPDTFQVSPDGHYARDAQHVYFENIEITSADPETFEILADAKGITLYSKDASAVYYARSNIKDADPASFRLLLDPHRVSTGFGKDIRSIFISSQRLPIADPTSFTLLLNDSGGWTGWAKDRTYLYHAQGSGVSTEFFTDAKLQSLHGATAPDRSQAATGVTFQDWTWYPLNTHFNEQTDYYITYRNRDGAVYFITPNRAIKGPIDNADPATFEFAFSTNQGISLGYGRDAHHVYIDDVLLPEADPLTFEPLFTPAGNMTRYSKDNTRVFCGTHSVPEAHPATFMALDSASGTRTNFGLELRKSIDQIYYCDQFIQGVDSSSFQVVMSKSGYAMGDYSKDTAHVYYRAKIILGADPATFYLDDVNTDYAYDKNTRYVKGYVIR